MQYTISIVFNTGNRVTSTFKYNQIREPTLDSFLFSYLGAPLLRPIVIPVMQANPLPC